MLIVHVDRRMGIKSMKGILLGAVVTILGTAAYVMIGIALASVS
jgi:hypothetical protein